MVVAILFLLALIDVPASLEATYDPAGWNSYFATEQSDNIDVVDVVDPSGWNYNRETKSSERNVDLKMYQEKQPTHMTPAQQVSAFCQRVLEEKNAETNIMVHDEINTAIKIKVAEAINKKVDVNENLVFIRRFIGIILNTADLTNQYLEKGSDVDVSGVIEIKMSPEHLKTLNDFINSEVNVSMRELDTILSTSFHRKFIPTLSTSELIDKFFFRIRQKEIWLPIVLVFIILFVSRLLLISKTNTCLITSLLFLIFTVSYVVEYYRLYKEVEIKQKIILDTHSEVPKECDPRNQHWFSALYKSFFSFEVENTKCVEYYKAISLDPLVEVSPSRVLSNILADFILSPFSKLGKAIAAFTSGIMGGLPSYISWLVWVCSSVAICSLIALVLVILIGGRIQLYGPFSGVSISRQAPSITNHQTPSSHQEELPPAASATSATPVARSARQPLLEAVSGMSNFVLMDADSLGTLVLRAQTSLSTVHSGVQELNRPCKEPLPSKQNEIGINKLQQTITEKEDSILKTVSETFIEKQGFERDDITSVVEDNGELRSPDNVQIQEVLGTVQVIPSDLASGELKENTGK